MLAFIGWFYLGCCTIMVLFFLSMAIFSPARQITEAEYKEWLEDCGREQDAKRIRKNWHKNVTVTKRRRF